MSDKPPAAPSVAHMTSTDDMIGFIEEALWEILVHTIYGIAVVACTVEDILNAYLVD